MSEPLDAAATEPDAPAASDGSIPMLTEIIGVRGQDLPTLPAAIEHVDWAGLAERVRDDVLARLMQHSDAMLATELRDTLAPLLDRTMRQLGDELQDRLSRLVRELVARAVADEITRLHDEITRRDPRGGAF